MLAPSTLEDNTPSEEVVGDAFYAARTGDQEWLLECLQVISSQESDALRWHQLCDENGCGLLHMICANGHLDLLRHLVDFERQYSGNEIFIKDAVNAANHAGNTPLHWAALNNHGAVVEALLALGADVGCRNAGGRTPVYEAEQRGLDEITKMLMMHLTLDDSVESDSSGDASTDQDEKDMMED